MIKELKGVGYKVFICFLDLRANKLALSRVRYRVETGGHDIPEETICRRYLRSRSNFWYNYKELADNWYLFNNSSNNPEMIASSVAGEMKLEEHKRKGVPAVYRQNGKIVYLMPNGKIVEKPPARKSAEK